MGKKHKFDYFDAFEQQTKLAVRESELLIETVKSFTSADELAEPMKRAHELEHEADEVNHAIFKNTATDFITPIDREDIVELAHSLDDIIDYIEDVIQRFYMYDIHFMHNRAPEFAKLIKQSCEALDSAMQDFHNFKKSKKFKQLIVQVHAHEEAADRHFLESIRSLHTTDRENPMRVHVWSNIFDRMEKCCDACEHAADTMSTIMLKNM